MIEFRNVTAVRAQDRLLDRMSFKLANGRVYGILGDAERIRTVAALLVGAHAPAEGTVQINGFDLWKESARAKAFLAFAPEKPSLYTDLTVLEYLLFLADVRQIEYEKGIRLIGELLFVTGLSHKRDVLISTLSLFEKKCLGIVQTCLSNAEILVLEDPFLSLTSQEAESLSAMLEEILSGRTAILCASKPAYLRKLCDVVYTASASALLSDGTSENGKEEN